MRNPYPGLRSFDEEESRYFFGREHQVDELLLRLHSARFVAVVGFSGCGKSSLVRAGLVPRIMRGDLKVREGEWVVVRMQPGMNPIASLVEALFPDADEQRAKLMRQLVDYDDSLTNLADGLLSIPDSKQGSYRRALLLIVDQFEELFSAAEKHHPAEVESFIDRLLETVAQESVPVRIVITLRSDQLGHCSRYVRLAEMLNRSQFLVPHLKKNELRAVIEEPPYAVGSKMTPELVDHILMEGAAHERLPNLQHVLMRTFEEAFVRTPPKPGKNDLGDAPSNGASVDSRLEISDTITLQDYKNTGGIDDALNIDANRAWNDLGRNCQSLQAPAKTLILMLCDISQNGQWIRRRTSVAEIKAQTGMTDKELAVVLRAFQYRGRQFLTPLVQINGVGELTEGNLGFEDDDMVDLCHESFLREWDLFRAQWLPEEQKKLVDFQLLLRREESSREGASYLQATDCSIAERLCNRLNDYWFSRNAHKFQLDPSNTEQLSRVKEFVIRSRHELEAEEFKRVERLNRDKEMEERWRDATADRKRREQKEQQQRQKLLRVLTYVLSIAVIVVGIAAIRIGMDADTQNKLAVENERLLKEANARAGDSRARSDMFLNRAKSYMLKDPMPDVQALRDLTLAIRLDPGNHEALQRISKALATKAWSVPITPVLKLPKGGGPLLVATFAPNGQIVAVGRNGNLLVCDDEHKAMTFSQWVLPKEDEALVQKLRGAAKSKQVPEGLPNVSPVSSDMALLSASFSDDARALVVFHAPFFDASASTGQVWEWSDAKRGYLPLGRPLELKDKTLYRNVFWRPDNQSFLLTRWDENSSQIFQREGEDYRSDGETRTAFSNADVTGGAFSPDGRLLVTASHDGTVQLLDASTLKAVNVNGLKASFKIELAGKATQLMFGPRVNEITLLRWGLSPAVVDLQKGAMESIDFFGTMNRTDQLIRIAMAPQENAMDPWSPERLVAVAHNQRLEILRLKDLGNSVMEPICYRGLMAFPAFSRDGKKILTLSGIFGMMGLDSVRVWDLETPALESWSDSFVKDGDFAPSWLADLANIVSGKGGNPEDEETDVIAERQKWDGFAKAFSSIKIEGKYQIIWSRFSKYIEGRAWQTPVYTPSHLPR